MHREAVKPGSTEHEQLDVWLRETLNELETLIVERLVKGRRVLQNGHVMHTELELTERGEAEAIRSRREPKRLIIDL